MSTGASATYTGIPCAITPTHPARRRLLAVAPHRTLARRESLLGPAALPAMGAMPPALAPPSQTPERQLPMLPSSTDTPTMRRSPNAPRPLAVFRPSLSPPQSAALDLLLCAVYACPPHATQNPAVTDGLGAAL